MKVFLKNYNSYRFTKKQAPISARLFMFFRVKFALFRVNFLCFLRYFVNLKDNRKNAITSHKKRKACVLQAFPNGGEGETRPFRYRSRHARGHQNSPPDCFSLFNRALFESPNYLKLIKKHPQKWMLFNWRRRGDSNSRAGYPTYALSRGASSPT